MDDLIKFQNERIEALLTENKRLNDEILKLKDLAFKVRISNPDFDKPLSELERSFEIIPAN